MRCPLPDLDPLWVVDDAGVTIPDADALLTQAIDAATEEVGGDYLFHPEDPLTQLMEIFSMMLAHGYQLIEVIHNSRDPAQAQGVLLRELGSIVGAEIPQRTRSVIAGRFIGTPGALVPSGSIVKYLATGDLWRTFQSYTIGAGGIVNVELESVEYAAIDAEAAGVSSWEIQTPTGNPLTFLSTDDADVGRAAATNAEVREAIELAATGGAGQATYDSDVQNVSQVDGVTHVALFVNRELIYSAPLDLEGKQGRFIIEGGRKQALFDAIASTASTGLNVQTTGTVQGSSTRSDGKIINVSFSRPVDVPVLVRVTLSGDLPVEAETEALVFAAIEERAAEQDFGEKVIPAQYIGAITAAFGENVVETITVEMRLDSGDPWSTDPIVLDQIERAEISSSARPASVTSTAEDPISATAGLALDLTVDGGGAQNYVLLESHTTVASLIDEIATEFTDVEFIDLNGRLKIRTVSEGAGSSLVVAGNLCTALGITPDTYNGTDGDITVVIV